MSDSLIIQDFGEWINHEQCECPKSKYRSTKVMHLEISAKDGQYKKHKQCIQICFKCSNCEKLFSVTIQYSPSGVKFLDGQYTIGIRTMAECPLSLLYYQIFEEYRKSRSYNFYHHVLYNDVHYSKEFYQKLSVCLPW